MKKAGRKVLGRMAWFEALERREGVARRMGREVMGSRDVTLRCGSC